MVSIKTKDKHGLHAMNSNTKFQLKLRILRHSNTEHEMYASSGDNVYKMFVLDDIHYITSRILD
jgi:hypothetical protein